MHIQAIRASAFPIMFFLLSHAAITSAAPVEPRSYVFFSEVAAVDQAGKTLTLKARIPDYVAKYVDRFKPDEKLVIVWNMIGKTQADQVLALWKYDDVKDAKGGNTGFVLPVEFVSASVQEKMVTFTTQVVDAGVLKSAQPGGWVKVTAPTDQPSQEAVIASIEPSDPPAPTPASSTSENQPAK